MKNKGHDKIKLKELTTKGENKKNHKCQQGKNEIKQKYLVGVKMKVF